MSMEKMMILTVRPTRLLHSVLVATLAAILLMGTGCRKDESHAAEPEYQPLAGLDLHQIYIPSLATMHMPRGWEYTVAEYPSNYGHQPYKAIRATFSPEDEDVGLLTIDISPSHPRLWRKSLKDLVAHRLRALQTLGDIKLVPPAVPMPERDYQVEERHVLVGAQLSTVFQVFRQKSRVVNIAYTAKSEYFHSQRAAEIVREVAESLVLHLPAVQFEVPDLNTSPRTIHGVMKASLPSQWTARTQRSNINGTPIHTISLTPQNSAQTNDRPTLRLMVANGAAVGSNIQVNSIGNSGAKSSVRVVGVGPNETVLQVDQTTMAIVRVVKLANSVVTMTYSAPDYLFEVKSALALLDQIAGTIEVFPAERPIFH
jgi:hypothetical protein